MLEHLKSIPGKFSMKTDVLSSRVYKEPLTATLRWADSNGVMQSIVLELVQFSILKNADAMATHLFDIM